MEDLAALRGTPTREEGHPHAALREARRAREDAIWEWRLQAVQEFIDEAMMTAFTGLTAESFLHALSDGTVLCSLSNRMLARKSLGLEQLKPASLTALGKFRQLAENVGQFQRVCRKLGVSDDDMLCATDLTERRARPVVGCLLELSRITADLFTDADGEPWKPTPMPEELLREPVAEDFEIELIERTDDPGDASSDSNMDLSQQNELKRRRTSEASDGPLSYEAISPPNDDAGPSEAEAQCEFLSNLLESRTEECNALKSEAQRAKSEAQRATSATIAVDAALCDAAIGGFYAAKVQAAQTVKDALLRAKQSVEEDRVGEQPGADAADGDGVGGAEGADGTATPQAAKKSSKGAFWDLRDTVASDLASCAEDVASMGASLLAAVEDMGDRMRRVVEVEQKLSATQTALLKESAVRRKLHNQLCELRGNIRVLCRIRPLYAHDKARLQSGESLTGAASDPLRRVHKRNATNLAIALSDDGATDSKAVRDGDAKHFEFDGVLGETSSQKEVYDAVSPLITSVLDGFHSSILAYGQTGSGKTFTMDGSDDAPGVNRRALEELFAIKREREARGEGEVSVTFSMVEIYNEKVRDLLSGAPPGANPELNLRQGRDGVYIEGVTVSKATSAEEVRDAMERGRSSRATASTNCNADSSRSHSVLIVNTESKSAGARRALVGRLVLVDLAGSERVSRSGAEGSAFKEAVNINKSLSTLGDVFHALRSAQGSKSSNAHIPFRNSKLTYLLSKSLQRHGKALMVIQVSPLAADVPETLCTLNFGSRVKAVELGAAQAKTAGEDAPERGAGGHGAQAGALEAAREKMERMQRALQAARRERDEAEEARRTSELSSRAMDRELRKAKMEAARAKTSGSGSGAGNAAKEQALRDAAASAEARLKEAEREVKALRVELRRAEKRGAQLERKATRAEGSSTSGAEERAERAERRLAEMERRLQSSAEQKRAMAERLEDLEAQIGANQVPSAATAAAAPPSTRSPIMGNAEARLQRPSAAPRTNRSGIPRAPPAVRSEDMEDSSADLSDLLSSRPSEPRVRFASASPLAERPRNASTRGMAASGKRTGTKRVTFAIGAENNAARDDEALAVAAAEPSSTLSAAELALTKARGFAAGSARASTFSRFSRTTLGGPSRRILGGGGPARIAAPKHRSERRQSVRGGWKR